jgi:hypothetical protein
MFQWKSPKRNTSQCIVERCHRVAFVRVLRDGPRGGARRGIKQRIGCARKFVERSVLILASVFKVTNPSAPPTAIRVYPPSGSRYRHAPLPATTCRTAFEAVAQVFRPQRLPRESPRSQRMP